MYETAGSMFWIWVFGAWDLFRISDFEFRALNPLAA
jgi:hypothetical protein